VLKLQTPLENPLSTFAYALQSEGTKRQYPRKLKVFFDFCLQHNNDLETQAVEFAQKCSDRNWVNAQIINFIIFQKERMYKEGISAGTVRNTIKPYYKRDTNMDNEDCLLCNGNTGRIGYCHNSNNEHSASVRTQTMCRLCRIQKLTDEFEKNVIDAASVNPPDPDRIQTLLGEYSDEVLKLFPSTSPS